MCQVCYFAVLFFYFCCKLLSHFLLWHKSDNSFQKIQQKKENEWKSVLFYLDWNMTNREKQNTSKSENSFPYIKKHVITFKNLARKGKIFFLSRWKNFSQESYKILLANLGKKSFLAIHTNWTMFSYGFWILTFFNRYSSIIVLYSY